MANTALYLQNCLFFTANALARNISRMADKAFKDTDLSPSHAFAIMLIVDTPGITIKELADHLHLAHSTMVRFMDKLVYQGLVERKQGKKIVQVYPTAKAKGIHKNIEAAWKQLYEDYSAILGKTKGDQLTRDTFEATKKLEDLA